MSALRLSRRGLFGGFAALLAAPAIVRVASLMPVAAAPKPLTFSEMVATVLREHPDRLGENISQNNALMASLKHRRLIQESTTHFDWVQHDVLITADASWWRKALAT